ncbi:uncharacterized protein LOC135476426 [Liolophura sinensis]|uniref:uncharacterized protein LOC135476426 n=1 Tax=Liolophura sinensis TaxID=3198878 RepID=UPI0031582E66
MWAYEVAVDCVRTSGFTCEDSVTPIVSEAEKNIDVVLGTLGDLCTPVLCQIRQAQGCLTQLKSLTDVCLGITEARICVAGHTRECAGSALIEVSNILSEIQGIQTDNCFETPVRNLTTCFAEYSTVVEQILNAAGTSRVQRLCAVRQTKLACINTELSVVFLKNMEFATILQEIFVQGETFVQKVCSATVLPVLTECTVKHLLQCTDGFLSYLATDDTPDYSDHCRETVTLSTCVNNLPLTCIGQTLAVVSQVMVAVNTVQQFCDLCDDVALYGCIATANALMKTDSACRAVDEAERCITEHSGNCSASFIANRRSDVDNLRSQIKCLPDNPCTVSLDCVTAILKQLSLLSRREKCDAVVRAEACVESLDILQCKVGVREDIEGTLMPIRGAVDDCNIPHCQLDIDQNKYVNEGETRIMDIMCTEDPSLYCDQDGATCSFEITISFAQTSGTTPSCSDGSFIPQLVVGNHDNLSGTSFCGVVVDGSNWNETLSIPITAVSDGKFDGQQEWRVALMMTKSYSVSSIADYSVQFASFDVTVLDMDRSVSTCSVIADPHINSFDGWYLSVYLEGEFVLARHGSGSYEVHGWFQSCGGDGSCTCAVAVRSGDDVLVIDSCDRPDGSELPLEATLYKNGELTPGTVITSDNEGRVHKVTLPSGTHIVIEVTSRKYLNVWIRASPSDWSSTRGLCGVYDGDVSNDLLMSNGTIFDPSDDEELNIPNVFSNSWRVDIADTYIEGVDAGLVLQPLATHCSCAATYLSGEVTQNVCMDQLHISTCDLSINPEFGTEDFVDSAIESLITRSKRQTNRRPLPRIDLNYDPEIPSWPSNGWYQENATDFCDDFLFRQSNLSRQCGEALEDLNLKYVLSACVDDIKVTGGIDWALSAWSSIRVACEQEARRTVVDQTNTTVLLNKLLSASCYQDCSGNGNCVDGLCMCDAGYLGSDCSVRADIGPQLMGIDEGHMCDVNLTSQTDCSTVTLRGYSFVNSPALECRFHPAKVSSTGVGLPSNLYSYHTATFKTFTKITCMVFQEPSSLEGLFVSASNGESVYGSEEFYLQYDSSCYTCESTGNLPTDVSCTIKPNTCDIEGRCYQAGQAISLEDPLRQCQPSSDQYGWTDITPPETTTTSGLTPCQLGQNCVNNYKIMSALSSKSTLCSGAETARMCLRQFSTTCPTSSQLEAELSAHISTLNLNCQIPNFQFLNRSTTLFIKEGEEQVIEFQLEEDPTLFCQGNCEILVHINMEERKNSAGILRCSMSGRVISQLVVGDLGDDVCGIRLSATNWNQRHQIPIRGRVDSVYDGQRIIDVTLSAEKLEEGVSVYSSVVRALTVYVEDEEKSYGTCAVLNDPHIVTTDGRYFNVFYEGEFILLKHKTLPYRVHTVFQQCSLYGVNASCTCAVAVQSGDDIFVVSRCRLREAREALAKGLGVSPDDIPAMVVRLWVNGEMTQNTSIATRFSGKQFDITLPHGALVQIQATEDFFNVWINPSVLDRDNTEGLCGTYNGNVFDDLLFRNGTDFSTLIDGDPLRAIYPNEMSKSWRVTSEESLLDGVPEKTVTMETHCTCPGPEMMRTYGVMRRCAANLLVESCNLEMDPEIQEMTTKDFLVRAASQVVVRRKRRAAAVEPLLDQLDVDYNYEPQSYFAWPTASGWTEEKAREYCENYLNQTSHLTTLCSQLGNFQYQTEMRACIEDIQISDGVDWALPALDSIRARCVGGIDRDFTRSDTGLISKIQSAACLSNCNNHGKCVDGKCVCDEGFEEMDCSLNSQDAPVLARFENFETRCESSQNNCTILTILGRNFAKTNGITCTIEEIELHTNGTVFRPGTNIASRPAHFLTFESVECDIQQSTPVAKRPILVSLGNSHGSVSRSLAYLVYHEDCYTCESNLRCTRKRDTCVIDGQCYIKNEPKPTDSCKLCDPDVMTDQWTYNDKCSVSSKGSNSDKRTLDIVMVASVCTAALVMIVILVGVIAFVRRHRRKKSSSREYLAAQNYLASSTGFSGTAVGMSEDSERIIWTPTTGESVAMGDNPVQIGSRPTGIVLDKYGGYRHYASKSASNEATP